MNSKKPFIKRKQIVAMNQHYKNYSLDYFLESQEKLGIFNIELWMSLQHFPLDSVNYGSCKELKKKISRKNQQIVCVTAPSCDYQYQYATSNKEHREKCIDYFSNALKVALELEAPMMTVNSGWGLFDESIEEGWKNSQEVIFTLSNRAEAKGLTLVMETLTKSESQLVYNKNRLIKYMEEIRSPALKVMVDTVAMSDAGEKLEDWFSEYGKDLQYMHFVDGKQSWDHYAWGDGEYDLLNFIKVINQNQYTGYLSQELITEGYLDEPFKVDTRNMNMLSNYIIE